VSCAAVVVDTNVPIVANGDSHASRECVASCARRLYSAAQHGEVVVDSDRRIIREYIRHLSPTGEPGPGDRFLKWLLRNEWNATRCAQVAITPRGDSVEDYEEFPQDEALARFDPADRKFVAVARAHPEHPPILEATDPDFWFARDVLEQYGVSVEFLCLDDIRPG